MAVHLRAGQALLLWHNVMLDEVRGDAPDLTLRQQMVLLTIYLEPPPHTVRGLAAKLEVSKPVISRALDTLGILKFVLRQRDTRDRRNVLVRRTLAGSLYVERLGDAIIAKARELPI